MKYILVYEIDDYPDTGDGTFCIQFETERELHQLATNLILAQKEKIKIIMAGYIQREWEYKIIKYAVKVEPELKMK